MANLCPKCARPLDADHFCDHCQLSVSVYKKIKDSSKILYNQGLQKAKVRDLSASIDLLSRSVRLNKNNTDARNLLGLIYFEIGETVSALQQWVVSKNLKAKDNEAVYFLNQVQDNQSYLDKLNQAIKKYNQSLTYIGQGSTDLAIIQLKKVTSLNPKYVRAYALLALCYIKEGNIDKAKKALHKVLAIDKSNFIARKYLDEINQDTVTSDDFKEEKPAKVHSGGAIGIRPVRTKVNNALFQFIAMAIGVVVGLAIMNYMVMPSKIDQKDGQINKVIADLSAAEADIQTLNDEVNRLEVELKSTITVGDEFDAEAKETSRQLKETIRVLNALNFYVSEEEVQAADNLFVIDPAQLPAEVSAIYDNLAAVVFPTVAEDAHNTGYTACQGGKLEEAVEMLTTSYKYAKTSEFSHRTLYFLARSYYKLDQIDTALPIFQKLIDEYPDSKYIKDAKYFINLNTD